jgi:hypothetical protein
VKDDFWGKTSLNAVLHWFLGRSTQWLSTGSAGERAFGIHYTLSLTEKFSP